MPSPPSGTSQGRRRGSLADLEATINKAPCDVVVIGTPIDLTRLVSIKKPTVRIR